MNWGVIGSGRDKREREAPRFQELSERPSRLASEAYRAIGGVARNSIANRAAVCTLSTIRFVRATSLTPWTTWITFVIQTY